MSMSNLRIPHTETLPIGHANQGCSNSGPRPTPVQCAVITSRAGEPRGNDRNGDNRRATSNERDHGRRANDNRCGNGHTRDGRRAPDNEDDEDGESSLGNSGRRRERIRVSQSEGVLLMLVLQ